MSTPIEIVREMQLWRRAQGKYGLDDYPPGMPFSPRQYGEAIDAVLRDAERFKALEDIEKERPVLYDMNTLLRFAGIAGDIAKATLADGKASP